jgi:hypothetical protein
MCLVKREKGPSPSLVMRTHVRNVESGGVHIRIVNSCEQEHWYVGYLHSVLASPVDLQVV